MPLMSRKRKSTDTDGVEDPALSKRSKADTKVTKPEQLDDSEGNSYWELSAKRRVTISEFKGKTLVALREYYEKDGKTLPGKSGINLTIEQLNALILLLPDLTAALEEKGVSVLRPDYAGVPTPDEEDVIEPEREKKQKSKQNLKQNFEETSDEDN